MLNAAGLNVAGENNPNWKGGLVSKTCEHCGSPFVVKPQRRLSARCCSLKCWNIMQKGFRFSRIMQKGFGRKEVPIDERLAKHSRQAESGCIEWTGSKNEDGYGSVGYRGAVWLAHRLVWTLRMGDIPAGMCVLHRCDNPCCININHLWLGTHSDNMADMANKGRRKGVRAKPQKDGGGFEVTEVAP